MDRCRLFLLMLLGAAFMALDCVMFSYIWRLYHNRSYELAPGDMICLDSSFSTFWCDGIMIDGNGAFDAYLIEGELELLKRKQTKNIVLRDTLGPGEFKLNKINLLPNSELFIRGYSNDSALDYIWILDDITDVGRCVSNSMGNLHCPGALIDHTNIPYKIGKTWQQHSDHVLSYHVKSNAAYYILTRNNGLEESYVNITITAVRTAYDTRNTVQQCLAEYDCNFNFKFVSDIHVVTEIQEENSITLFTSCQNKATVLILVFMVLPAIVFAILVLALSICFSSHRNQLPKQRPNIGIITTAMNRRPSARKVKFATVVEEQIEVYEPFINDEGIERNRCVTFKVSAPLIENRPRSYGGITAKPHLQKFPNFPKTHNDVYNRNEFLSQNVSQQQNNYTML